MPVSKLKTFNAGVKGSTLGASGPKYVMVPQKHAAQLRESLASGDIAAVQPTQLADNTPLTSRSYKVRSGDTISGIASRLGVTTRDLQQWNNLRGSGLKVGQNLVIGAAAAPSVWRTTAIASPIAFVKAIRCRASPNVTALIFAT
ncbi:membrane-bound lytic murein transglycosylase D [Klebsiella pneumoniae]|uniref:Membrane-bound lytic murein transglycosylase D n=1 Tax=Klebsiella pneumoniae TaxID=573 RepID=A0A2X3DPA6_KLEPN|nr:membrane-bound lytic murein transglycosylase D [Klebsiella pneumoniae]